MSNYNISFIVYEEDVADISRFSDMLGEYTDDVEVVNQYYIGTELIWRRYVVGWFRDSGMSLSNIEVIRDRMV